MTSDTARLATDRVALVTGGAKGLGLAMAKGLRAAGARVVILDHDPEALAALEWPDGVIEADIAEPGACEAAVRQVEARHGRLDVLLNNAALGMGFVRDDHFAERVRLAETTAAHWQRMFAVNALGAVHLCRAATPGMVGRGWGRVINVTTSLFTMLNHGFAPYGPAKAALESASAIWAKEFDGTGVTVNVVVPGGPADTAMVPASAPWPRDALIPAEAMVAPVLWLVSPAGDQVTGRRYVGALWDPTLNPREAERQAGAPIGWPSLTTNAVWPGPKPSP